MTALSRGRRLALTLVLAAWTIGASRLDAQASGGCSGGGGGETAVATRVDATVLFERCLAGDRLAAIVLWRGSRVGWQGTSRDGSMRLREHIDSVPSPMPPSLPNSGGANDRFVWLAALDRPSGRVLIRTRDGDHVVPLGATDSVVVVMVDGVDAVSGPVIITTTRLAPSSTAGIVPSREQMHEALRTGAPLPALDIANRLRTLLVLDGFSRRFIADRAGP